MRIFFVCRRVPYPPDRGDKIATYNEIRHLARAHEVHVFCLADGRADLANIAGLDDVAASVTAVPLGELAIRRRALLGLLCRRSLTVAALSEPRLRRAIRAKVAALRPELFVVYGANVASYAEPFAGTPRIMQFGDLDSLRWGQYARRSRWPLNRIYAIEERRFLAYERKIAHSFSHAFVHTEIEQRDFARLIPGVAVSLLGNGVDLDYFRPAGGEKRPGGLVFTGVMDYLPNIDAVTWFCEAILPLVRRRLPRATLTICGSRPTAPVASLARHPGVEVTGWVPDTRPYLDRAEVFVAPLRMARGIQNKLLEAMAMALPCVATTTTWRGTTIAQGDGILVADEPAAFAEQIVRLSEDAALRQRMAQAARTAVEAGYRWETQLAELDRVIATLAPSPPAG
jgi:sugar transferase (PEP-CTERM/EpsH1 system associated)